MARHTGQQHDQGQLHGIPALGIGVRRPQCSQKLKSVLRPQDRLFSFVRPQSVFLNQLLSNLNSRQSTAIMLKIPCPVQENILRLS
jgi:hypothetical protein